jgi:hypothetical protein
MALKLVHRISTRQSSGIVISRGAAGRELVPSSVRSPVDPVPVSGAPGLDATGTFITDSQNELVYKSMLNARALPEGIMDYTAVDPDGIDLIRVTLPAMTVIVSLPMAMRPLC